MAHFEKNFLRIFAFFVTLSLSLSLSLSVKVSSFVRPLLSSLLESRAKKVF